MIDLEPLFAQLSREPDLDAPELQAHDAADLLVLETASAWVESGDHALHRAALKSGDLVTIGDRFGALTLGAAQRFGVSGIRAYQDPLLAERVLAANADRLGLADRYESVHELGEKLLGGATVVLMQLPRSLAELEEIVWHIARYAHPSVTVFAGGRDKHMSRGMNDVFARFFGEVTASRGWRKARVLSVRGLRASELGIQRPGGPDLLRESPSQPPFPVWGQDPDLPFQIAAYGATFGGATLDHGSRLLLRGLRERGWPSANRIVDLGSGNGVLAVSAALARPDARILATDQSASAVAATRATAAAAGVAGDAQDPESRGVHAVRADAAEAVPDGWAELILLNPPFHSGATVHAGVAHRLIRSCARALAPGGELHLVFNSHLRYRPLVERVIGETRQVARDRTFIVLSAIRRG